MVKQLLEKDYEFNVQFLDTLDLSKYIEKGKLVGDIIDEIEDDYDNDYEGSTLLPKELAGCIFNFMDMEEIVKYLTNRYGFKYYRIEDYRIW